MRLRVDHRFSDDIMEFLYQDREVIGNEEYLKGERVFDICSQVDMEVYLENKHDVTVNLPADLRLIEITAEEMLRECDKAAKKALNSMNRLEPISMEVKFINRNQ